MSSTNFSTKTKKNGFFPDKSLWVGLGSELALGLGLGLGSKLVFWAVFDIIFESYNTGSTYAGQPNSSISTRYPIE